MATLQRLDEEALRSVLASHCVMPEKGKSKAEMLASLEDKIMTSVDDEKESMMMITDGGGGSNNGGSNNKRLKTGEVIILDSSDSDCEWIE